MTNKQILVILTLSIFSIVGGASIAKLTQDPMQEPDNYCNVQQTDAEYTFECIIGHKYTVVSVNKESK